jgi:hypothetical protein
MGTQGIDRNKTRRAEAKEVEKKNQGHKQKRKEIRLEVGTARNSKPKM